MSKRAAFFDLDKTLIPGSSLFLLARGMYDRDFYRVWDIVRLGCEQVKFQIQGESERGMEVSRQTALEFVSGRSRGEMVEMATEIAREKILPRVYEGITNVIHQHQKAGDLTFLTTASPQEIADVIANSLDMTGALGTKAQVDTNGIYTGELEGELLHGAAKARAVEDIAEERDINLSESFAYSDSLNDLPLLEAIGNPHVVNPESKLKEKARKRGWPMFELRTRRLGLLIGIPSVMAAVGFFGAGIVVGTWLSRESPEASV